MEIVTAITAASTEHQRASKRLREAARAIAAQVREWLEAADLHRCGDFYRANQFWRGQQHDTTWIYWREICLNGCGGLFAGDFNSPMPDAPTGGELLAFAKAIKEGSLDRLRDELTKKATVKDAASEVLEAAI